MLTRTLVLTLLLASPLATAQDKPAAPPTPPSPQTNPATQPALAELERKFEQTMTNAVLVGRFTAGNRDQNPKEERYSISSAKKLFGERWIITAKIQYGGKGETAAIPLIVPVKFAGDTPVISITNLSIPGMGTYSARVMIYDDQYAGMWDAGQHGGLMWGRIERAATPQPAAAPVK